MVSSEGLHEPPELLSQESMDRHRALASLMEELEAIDWYSQRVEATQDGDLRQILQHNRDEEVEHAAMVLEWLRRRDPTFARQLAERLSRSGSIVNDEPASGEAPADGRLHIGSLRTPAAGEEAGR